MKRTTIIAELAQGFEGDSGLCRRFIDVAKKAGADGVKFQIFEADELCTPDYPYFGLFRSLEISAEKWTELIHHAVSQGLGFYADVFGLKTLEWMKRTSITGFKIHSTDTRNYPLLEALKGSGKTVFLSAGGTYLDEVERALPLLAGNDVVVMSGFQGEPNQPEDVELDKIPYLISAFGLPVGYADHIDANDPLATVLPSMAVLRGATWIEKHLTLERNFLQLEDHISALNPSEFIQMTELIRKTERFSRMEGGYKLSQREEEYRRRGKKVPLAAREIPAGKIITHEDIVLLRTGKEFREILDRNEVIGRKALHNLGFHDVIGREDLDS